MSENNKLVLEPVADPATQRNFDLLNQQQIGRGPAQARVFNDANISIANNTVTALTFNSERFDTGNFHSTSSNTSRLTAPTAGLYLIDGSVRIAANSTGRRRLAIRLNGTTDIRVVEPSFAPSATVQWFNDISTLYQLAPPDYVELTVFQTSGGALNVDVAGNYSPEFSIVRLGSQA